MATGDPQCPVCQDPWCKGFRCFVPARTQYDRDAAMEQRIADLERRLNAMEAAKAAKPKHPSLIRK